MKNIARSRSSYAGTGCATRPAMGGNALRADSVRLPAARYRAVEQAALETLRAHYPGRRIAALAAFAGKADFGDLDILIEAGSGYDPASCAAALQATEIVLNGDVCSIGVRVEPWRHRSERNCSSASSTASWRPGPPAWRARRWASS